MKKLAGLFSALSVLLVIFMLTNTADAQRRREARGKRLTKAQVEQIIKRIEERTDDFVKEFDASLDRSRLDGTRREDQLNKRVKDFENATDDLRREFDRRDAWYENKDEVRKCLNIAGDINKVMRNRKLGARTESDWANLRFELNTLADVYNLPKVRG